MIIEFQSGIRIFLFRKNKKTEEIVFAYPFMIYPILGLLRGFGSKILSIVD